MRYLPLTAQNRKEMLQAIGAASVDELFKDVPKTAFMKGLANLPMHMGEIEIEKKLGPKFDHKEFHDYILSQGLLPPAMLRKAVLERFVK